MTEIEKEMFGLFDEAPLVVEQPAKPQEDIKNDGSDSSSASRRLRPQRK